MSKQWLSFSAPQHPKKPTASISTPKTVRKTGVVNTASPRLRSTDSSRKYRPKLAIIPPATLPIEDKELLTYKYD